MKNIYIRFTKPVFDYFFAFLGAVISLPVLLFLYIFYLLNGEKGFFFVQKRIGEDERPFSIYKVKTLKENPYGDKGDDERKFWFSDFIRKTSIDELPQLINIFKGEMSFIGPRPLLPQYLPLYNERQRKRHLVRPGITGYSQVNADKIKDWVERLEMDVVYVENMSFLFDLKILVKTLVLIFRGRDLKELDEPFLGDKR